jgi:hypothetical protein
MDGKKDASGSPSQAGEAAGAKATVPEESKADASVLDDILKQIKKIEADHAAEEERHRAHVESIIAMTEHACKLTAKDNRLLEPERVIDELFYFVQLLKGYGLNERQAIKRIDQRLRVRALDKGSPVENIEDYATLILKRDYPAVFENGDEQIREELAKARSKFWGRHFECQGELFREVSRREFERCVLREPKGPLLYYRVDRRRGRNEILLLRRPGDKLWWWCRGEWTWQALMGRSSIALVRGEYIIAEMVMLIN